MQEDLATDDVMLLDTWDQVGGGQKAWAVWDEGGARLQLLDQLPEGLKRARCCWKGP